MSDNVKIAEYQSYNFRRYSAPWAAQVTGLWKYDFSVGIYTGGKRSGGGGDLLITAPVVGAVYAYGQKDSKGGPRNSDPHFAVYMGDNTFRAIDRPEVPQALEDYNANKAAIARPADIPSLGYWRKKAGLTQQQLADLAGINIRQVQRAESGESQLSNFTAINLLRLADVLGIDPYTLIGLPHKEARNG